MDLVLWTVGGCELNKLTGCYWQSTWTCDGLETFSIDSLKFFELFWASWGALFIIFTFLVRKMNKVKQLISEHSSILLKRRLLPPEKFCDNCDSMGCLHWSRLLAGPGNPWTEKPKQEQICWQDFWPFGEPTLKQTVPEGLYPWENHCWSSLWRARGKVPHWTVFRVLSPIEGAPHWSGRMTSPRRK